MLGTWAAVLLGCVLCGALGFFFESNNSDG